MQISTIAGGNYGFTRTKNRAPQEMRGYMAEFGMTPANRAKVQTAQVPEQNDLFEDNKPNPGRFFGGNNPG